MAGRIDGGWLVRVLILLSVIGCCSGIALADTIGVGLLTYDGVPLTSPAVFDITNLTGANSFAPDFPITTQLTFTITSLVANLQGGGTLTIDGGNFTSVDPQGDLNCTVAGDASTGGCDLAAYNLLSATLSGTLSPLTGLAGLPAGDIGIANAFTATIMPDAECGTSGILTPGCDAAVIYATGVARSAVPEPSTWILLATALAGGVMFRLRSRFQL
jgi:hypothetical protein